MHGVSIPLVADKAALGKSTVHDILRQVCSAISNHFGHHIVWPAGRKLARVTAAFQAKQWLPNCIGAIDGMHIYISAPPNSIAAADHRNRYKSFSILLQAVVDSRCFFTSVNTGPPGSLHDSAHFKSMELYRKVEEGIIYRRVPRRPNGIASGTPISTLHIGGPRVPSLKLVHNTIQDGTHGVSTHKRGGLV